MAWLINSMEMHIHRTYLFLCTAKAIWDDVIENFSDLKIAFQVFEIKNKLKDSRQGNLDITQYYNVLQTLWLELDMHYEADWGDLEGNVKFKRHLEKERLYDFLAGLNKELDEEQGSEKMIGIAKDDDRLYYFENDEHVDKQATIAQNISSTSNKDVMM
ncbi:uncharacterized protein LOC112090656 [Morus notabilis]|uniref:uncharacterized protein LOC112090656 n=1 Tax=Morus notabilis TaxID=981085 RepID=UPI000CED13CB|nr:uncharacterized protein LOC112090656 [Morus notabilis]